ncbi:hypothetical protein [Tenacibaculum haliotis]|uniref:hypothetical protein n=1 Tax=Tenacibaculum haliotis TaxID=1888914 RepID=UPI0021AF7174|nr:hypothetical protein [Tenacibaculum haliotis]MCT4698268.1 hypothetical protein [Tenacibaculum haliotis]
MKKLLILSIAVFTFFSCSDNEKSLDLIIGSWQEQQEPRANKAADSCWEMNTTNWKEDFSFTQTDYDNDGGNCVAEEENIGTWKNNDNGTYTFTVNNRKESKISSQQNNDIVFNITFSNNNNTMTLSLEGEEYEEVYTRAE